MIYRDNHPVGGGELGLKGRKVAHEFKFSHGEKIIVEQEENGGIGEVTHHMETHTILRETLFRHGRMPGHGGTGSSLFS